MGQSGHTHVPGGRLEPAEQNLRVLWLLALPVGRCGRLVGRSVSRRAGRCERDLFVLEAVRRRAVSGALVAGSSLHAVAAGKSKVYRERGGRMSVSDHSVGSELLGYRIESFLGRGHGDLFAGLQGFETALATSPHVGPLGQIWLDQIDQAVGPAYPSQYLKSGGGVGFRPIRVVANADRDLFGRLSAPKTRCRA